MDASPPRYVYLCDLINFDFTALTNTYKKLLYSEGGGWSLMESSVGKCDIQWVHLVFADDLWVIENVEQVKKRTSTNF